MHNILLKLNTFFQSKTTARVALLGLLLIGVFIFRDYGLGWDEPDQMETGRVSYVYAFHHDNSLYNFVNKDYGVAFEMPVWMAQMFIQKKFNATLKQQFYLKHLIIHLLFLFSIFCFYRINVTLFKNNAFAFLACAILIISPRIYGDSFHNSKDLTFLSANIITFYTFILFFKKHTLNTLIIHALTCAVATNLRILGILMVGFTIINLGLDTLSNKISTKQLLKFSLLFLILFCAVLYISWPFLWENPLGNFKYALIRSGHFTNNFNVLDRGVFIMNNKLPWYYLFTWIGITTPELYLLFFVIGFILSCWYLVKNLNTIIKTTENRNLYVAMSLIILPVAAEIILKSVLYDGWRQMFFIYPFIVIISVFGIVQLYKFLKQRNRNILISALIVIFGINFLYIGGQMVYFHPFQNCYFNNMISHKENNLRHNFEMDYWGLSSRKALEYLVNKGHPDRSDTIRLMIQKDCAPPIHNLIMLDIRDKKRIQIVDTISKADYFITNYRRINYDFTQFPEEVFKINVLNSSIVSVFRVK